MSLLDVGNISTLEEVVATLRRWRSELVSKFVQRWDVLPTRNTAILVHAGQAVAIDGSTGTCPVIIEAPKASTKGQEILLQVVDGTASVTTEDGSGFGRYSEPMTITTPTQLIGWGDRWEVK